MIKESISKISISEISRRYVMRCAIWYHLYNLKNVKNNHGCSSRFLNCTNGTESRIAPHIHKWDIWVRVVLLWPEAVVRRCSLNTSWSPLFTFSQIKFVLLMYSFRLLLLLLLLLLLILLIYLTLTWNLQLKSSKKNSSLHKIKANRCQLKKKFKKIKKKIKK